MFALFWAVLIVFTTGDATASAAPPTQAPCDNGRNEHAQGVLENGLYTVIWGDTVYSVSRRFCVSEWDLRQANHMRHSSRLYAGTKIVIPGGGSGEITPDEPIIPGDGSCTDATTIAITAPAPNTNVGTTFQVSGQATVRRNSLVVVRAFDANGRQLGQRDTYLNWTGRNGNCLGTFAVTLDIPSTASSTEGYVVATVAGVTSERVPVIYGQGSCPFLTITAPRANERLATTFAVNGQGCLTGASPRVEARAVNAAGATLATETVSLQNGQYRANLSVEPGFEQGGRIIVTGVGTSIRQEVAVIFTTGNGGGSGTLGSYTDYTRLSCSIFLTGNEPVYLYPNAQALGSPFENGPRRGLARVDLADVRWYLLELSAEQVYWVRASDLQSSPTNCP
jgi:hypothetical protein